MNGIFVTNGKQHVMLGFVDGMKEVRLGTEEHLQLLETARSQSSEERGGSKDLVYRVAEFLSLTFKDHPSEAIRVGVDLLILDATERYEEHPDWYLHSCLCASCRDDSVG